jgi:hypothetical protein
MIKFSLVCAKGHEFVSWFRNGAAYEAQAKGGLISCPECQVTVVKKAIMAPAIAAVRNPGSSPNRINVPNSEPLSLLSQNDRQLRAAIEEFRSKVLEHSDDVGGDFPEEARKIHDGLATERAIHGRASFEEARALIEEGIGIVPIPALPDDFH